MTEGRRDGTSEGFVRCRWLPAMVVAKRREFAGVTVLLSLEASHSEWL